LFQNECRNTVSKFKLLPKYNLGSRSIRIQYGKQGCKDTIWGSRDKDTISEAVKMRLRRYGKQLMTVHR
jgi:hypothetical protein